MNLVAQARRMALSLTKGRSVVYVLRLQSGAFYVGSSTNIEERLNAHAAGEACRTTEIDAPTTVLFVEIQSDFATARKRETQIKKWSRAKKEALITGDIVGLKALSKSRD